VLTAGPSNLAARQVYWNSRLESEHLRLVNLMERGQV
jgi:hypothetical protein